MANVMYTASVPYSTATATLYRSWGQAMGQGLTALGWVPQTGHGEVVNNGLTGASFAWSNSPVVQNTTLRVAQPQQLFNYRGAWVSGTTYTGIGTTANQTTVDVVMDGGLTYMHVTASSSAATAPGADDTNWMPYNYEIFKSNGSMTSSLPIYIRVAYTSSATNVPNFHFAVGTGVDSIGNLTGVVQITNTTPITTRICSPGGTANPGNFDWNFSGDADNVRFITWRTVGGGAAHTGVQPFFIDRSKTSTGTDSDAYFYLGHIFSSGGNNTPWSIICMKSSLGSTIMLDGSRWSGVPGCSLTTGANFGAVPPLPVFPIVGYLANPCLGSMVFFRSDVSEGGVVSVWMYGAAHNYLITNINLVASASPNGVSGSTCLGILWE